VPVVVLDHVDVGGSESGLQAGFVVAGTPNGQNTHALNGVNVTDETAIGSSDFYYDYDALEEVQVSTGAHSIEVGPPGAYVNVITKSATDQWRGQTGFSYQSSGTQSNNVDQTLLQQGIQKVGFDYLSDATGQLGGPVPGTRLRLFGAFRDWRIHRFVPGFVDTQNNPVVEPTNIDTGLVHAVYQLTDAHRLDAFWTRQGYRKPQRGASALNTPLSTWREDDTSSVYQGTWTGIFRNQAYLEARASYTDVFFPLYIQDAAKAADNQSTLDLDTNRVTGANMLEVISQRKRLQADVVVSWVADRWAGFRHEFKAGWDFANSPSKLAISALDDVNLATFGGTPAFALLYNTPVHPDETVRTTAFLGSDTLRRGRLTFNVGARLERTQGIVPAQSSPAGTFAPARQFADLGSVVNWTTVSPRGAVAYQLTDDGRTVAKVSGARYYHQLSTSIPNAVNPNGVSDTTVVWIDRNGDGKFQPNEAGPVLSQFGVNQTSIDPSIKRPYTDELLVTLEREVRPSLRVSGHLTFRRERQQIGIRDVTSVWIPTVVQDPVTGANLTVFNKSPDSIGNERYRLINSPQLDQGFRGFDIVATKRFTRDWQMLGSYSLSRATQNQVSSSGDILGVTPPSIDPNDGVNATGLSPWDRTNIFKLSTSYTFPHDVLVAGNLRAQSGAVFTRLLSVDLNQGPVTVFAEPRTASSRLDALATLDLRASKRFRFSPRQDVEVFVDAYNLFNANTILDANPLTGPAYGLPLSVLSPRIFRFGGRFNF
jgi:hypothetical protein